MTYDQYGRTATASNGNGVTTTYSYDDLDRLLGMDYDTTPASPDVEYSYDTAGRLATREDVSGTTTYSYDAMSRLTSRVHTLDYEPVVYSYDKASRLKTTTDGRGTTEYLYDEAGATWIRRGARDSGLRWRPPRSPQGSRRRSAPFPPSGPRLRRRPEVVRTRLQSRPSTVAAFRAPS
nr:hypothetical protein [Cellulomonas sp. IC4_254]